LARHTRFRIGIAHDAGRGVPQGVTLEPVKRRRIRALQILPAEEHDACTEAAGRSHGEKRRQVVRLFVDMHQIGPELRQQTIELRVVMQMKTAVESQRRDDRL
jgi:hypothetical protein